MLYGTKLEGLMVSKMRRLRVVESLLGFLKKFHDICEPCCYGICVASARVPMQVALKKRVLDKRCIMIVETLNAMSWSLNKDNSYPVLDGTCSTTDLLIFAEKNTRDKRRVWRLGYNIFVL